MSNTWQTSTLERVCEFTNGLWKGEQAPLITVGVIRNTNFTKEGTLCDLDIAQLSVEARQFARRRLEFGDIILEKSGGGPKQPVGRVALFDKKEGTFSFSNFTAALRVRNAREMNFRFLHRFLHWTYLSGVTEGMQSHSTGIRNLDGDAYKAIRIAFPGLPEQERIVGIVEGALRNIAIAKANTERNLVNSRAVLECYRNTVFSRCGEGWQKRPLGELCEIKHGFAFKSEFFTSDGAYVLLTPGNFHESGGYRDRGDRQKYYSGDIPEGFVLSEGDLLVAMTEQAAGLLGSPVLIPKDGRFLHNQRLGLVTNRPGVRWSNEFFFEVFNTQAVRKAIHRSASGVKVRHTSPTKIGQVVVTFPTSLSEQQRIASTLRSLATDTERLQTIYTKRLAALEELKRSLLGHAFTGQL